MPRRDEDPEYKEFLAWKNNRKGADDDEGEDLDDDEGEDLDDDEDDDDEEDGGIAVLTGKQADRFIERMFGDGGGAPQPKRKTKTKTGKAAPVPDEEDDDEPDEDPEPANRGHRFFRDRRS